MYPRQGILLNGIAHLTYLTTIKYQHTLPPSKMHFHYLSFDKHFSFLSKHDKSSAFLKPHRYETYNQNIA